MAEPGGVAVLVAGAARAGVTSMARRLRERVPDCRVVEAHELTPGQVPVVLVWVVSATAPMTAAECVQASAAAASAGAIIAVVNKIDDHRQWRPVLAANEARWPSPTWVAAAAAPRLGVPRIDDVAAALAQQLSDPLSVRRAAARAREAERAAYARRRVQLQQLRLELTSTVRHRCFAARAELLARVATMRHSAQVEDLVRSRCQQIRADIEAELDAQVTARAPLPVLPDSPPPPFPSGRRLETQLMVVLGLGFGVGAAVVVARLIATLTTGPGWASAAGGVVGVALTAWVVRARGLLHDRARWERWTADVLAALRIELEEAVASRMLTVSAVDSAGHNAGHNPSQRRETTDFAVTER
ncbi:hypothetical protein [Mycolicibacterium obuense]|uniref:Uncharacterized protein n=1 Tax=Mycolicibacterium obuense TaxID=1807 RepID=A0A0J6VER9_9MYCO|nr:hypothetical protein [Mycolicibacterium obuense]KMO69500.1 hypothetical protein MOBUDSM44075_04926 [Mycolicibacterium obuense]